ncbi:MAG: 1-acyl-sn-glycerol-3-phosphate acyltransferase [Clostridia bacterium]|nr:1-acyl-sn-glycerol-3-phosphate acyltransferase [Clostridia bacterium]
MREIFRWLALLSAWPVQLLVFKRKTYYEDRRVQGRRVRGKALIVSNHFSVFDYMVNLFLFPFRKLYVVYWPQNSKRIRWGMKFFGGIVSDRDVMSLRFMDESVKVLEKGRVVQIYPEAYISEDGRMDEFKPSYVLIALRAEAPIIPVITDGQYGLFKRVHLIIGKPIDLWDYCTSEDPTKEEIMALNDIVYKKCLELQRELEARKQNKRRVKN